MPTRDAEGLDAFDVEAERSPGREHVEFIHFSQRKRQRTRPVPLEGTLWQLPVIPPRASMASVRVAP